LTDFSRIYILAEDARQHLFVRRYLYRAGYERHVIDPDVLPKGTGGAGERWVRQRYAAAVAKYRKRAARAKTALIVVIDADTETVSRRIRQLSEILPSNPRTDSEPIAFFIPKRNIETWILHLTGEDVDETKDPRHRDVDDLIPAAAAKFHEWAGQAPAHCLPSLAAAIEESRRLT
jgi:hypothetical protein